MGSGTEAGMGMVLSYPVPTRPVVDSQRRKEVQLHLPLLESHGRSWKLPLCCKGKANPTTTTRLRAFEIVFLKSFYPFKNCTSVEKFLNPPLYPLADLQRRKEVHLHLPSPENHFEKLEMLLFYCPLAVRLFAPKKLQAAALCAGCSAQGRLGSLFFKDFSSLSVT
ncbi:hypothetical protein L3X38_020527 [Prunus dulcis]|uniref:Uncharacterized protein n=1 Tax=Prunus dulcis TaxID=3755 RepID=A0AAD4WD25_PRUDU|nr:hypothetical protein L3X38_020527 [Prunus dulcis]